MVRIAEDAGYHFDLLKGVIVVNDEQRERMVDKVMRALGDRAPGGTVAAWGLTFKANTDDLRESPALAVLASLAERGLKIRAYDPQVSQPLPGIDVVGDPYEACDGADVLVVLTEWDQFRWLDLHEVRARLNTPSIVDTRNLLDRAAAIRAGFSYQGVGR
jgi:UDPglucose 6-dehydrogenase